MQRSYNGCYSQGKLEIHDKSRFNKMFSTKVLQMFQRSIKIGYLTLINDEVKVVVLKLINLIKPSVGRGM